MFVAPAVIVAAVLLYLPFLWAALLSFTEYRGLGAPEFVGLDNYAAMFDDPNFTISLRNTVIWVLGTILVPVALGLLIAVLTYNHRFGTWLRLPFLLPYALSGVGIGVVFGFLLQTHGAINQMLDFLGLPGAATRFMIDAPINTFTMIAAASWQAVGVNALLFVVGLQSIPKSALEAARMDGAGPWQLFRHITWPLLRPLTTVVVGLSIVASLKTFDIVWTMTEGGPGRRSETLAVTMYRETFSMQRFGMGAAIAVFLTALTFIAAMTYLRRQLSERPEKVR
ncbi:sugar ABC transporter permease [Phytoactinopolyspora limicola]|uniref:carbohydrate ABC transporter permease n=1 Tax=Phytoactinopolyspora limicola TaxID=2715536 RepID=UPI0031B646F5